MKVLLTILIMISSTVWSQDAAKEIFDASSQVLSGDKAALKTLYELSLDSKNEKLRPQLVHAVTLLMLVHSPANTKKYIQTVQKQYQDKTLFKFLEYPPLRVECADCKGYGNTHVECRRCKDGNCRNCKGEGVITYGNGKSRKENGCSTCKATGYCSYCKGTKNLSSKCRTCRTSGFAFNAKAAGSESKKILSVLMTKAAEIDTSLEIESDPELMKQYSEMQTTGEKWLASVKQKQSDWPEMEKKRFAAMKKKKKKAPGLVTMVEEEVVETYEEGGSTPTLDRICLEISEYLKGQERKSKQNILVKVYGQFLSDLPTVHIVVTDEFVNSAYDYKQRAADGFFRFTLLRAQRNGYDEIGFKLLNNAGEQIGGIKDNEFVLNK